MENIKISVTNKIPVVEGTPCIVCGNSSYTITFAFDEEWAALPSRTARFVYSRGGLIRFQDVAFEGDTVVVPVLSNIREVQVGVFAGDLKTTAPARILCKLSILCSSGEADELDPGAYAKIMERLDRIEAGTLPDYSADTAGMVLSVSSQGVPEWVFAEEFGGNSAGSYRLTRSQLLPFRNKKICFFGDSLSYYRDKWIDPFLSLCGAAEENVKVYARGYATFTNKADTVYDTESVGNTASGDNVIWNQFNRMKADIDNGAIEVPDIVFIMAGTNDALQSLDVGTPSEVFTAQQQSQEAQTLLTLSDSIRFVCDLLYTNFPSTKVVLITPPIMGNGATNAARTKVVADTIVESCKLMALPCINAAEECGIASYREQIRKEYYNEDGVHLSEKGGALFAGYMHKKILSMVLHDPVEYEYTLDYVEVANIESITAEVAAGFVLYSTTTLDEIRDNLTVTAYYSDLSSNEVKDYSVLPFDFVVGTNEITVSYLGKTAKVSVEGQVKIVPYLYDTLEAEDYYASSTAVNTFHVFDQVVPNADAEFVFYATDDGSGYFIQAERDGNTFTPLTVIPMSVTAGMNKVSVPKAGKECYVGFYNCGSGCVKVKVGTVEQAAVGRQFSTWYRFVGTNSFIPTVGTPIETTDPSVSANAVFSKYKFACILNVMY